MKKRVLLLITAVFMNMFVPAFAQTEDAVLNEDQAMLIQALGIDDFSPADDKEITRGEWSYLLSTAVFGNSDGFSGGKQIFSDVDKSNKYYNGISLLHGIEAIKGYLNGNYGTEDSLSVEQAVMTMTRVLYRDSENSDFAGPKKNDLLKGTNISDNNKISLNNAYIMIYNMMNEEIYLFNSDDELLFMEYRRGIYKVKGVVSDDGKNSLSGESTYRNNEIEIDGELYTNTTDSTDLFGYYVTGYFLDDGEAKLLSVSKTSKNEELVIYSDDIEDYDVSKRTYMYYNNSEKSSLKKIAIDTDITTVYNGRTLGVEDISFKSEDYKPENGYVKLLDNNGDEDYDVVFVYDYKTGVVSANDLENEKIYLKLEAEEIGLKEVKCSVVNADGNKIAIDEIQKDMVISYAWTADREAIEIIVTNNTTEDILKSFDYNEKIITTKTGGEYSLSDYLLNNDIDKKIKLGGKYLFYFDNFNKVVHIDTIEDNTWNVAYLSKTVEDESGEFYYVRLIGFGEKETMCTLAERVALYKEDNTYQKSEAEKVYYYLNEYIMRAEEVFSGHSSLIRYKTDINGNINIIELPLWKGQDLTEAGEDRLCVILNSANKEEKYQSSGHFEGRCGVDNGTLAMMMAKGDNESILMKKADFVHNRTYRIVAYTTTPKSIVADYILLPLSDSKTSNYLGTYFALSDINEVYDEDEGAVTELKGWEITSSARVEKSYKITDESVIKNVKDFSGNSYKMSPGDILFISLNGKKDVINGIYMIYDKDGKNATGQGSMGDEQGLLAGVSKSYYTGSAQYGNPYGFSVNSTTQAITAGSGTYLVGNRIFLGYVYDIEDTSIIITTQHIGNNSYKFDYDSSKYFTEILPGITSKLIKIKDTGKNVEVSQAQLSDIKAYTDYSGNCSKVLLIQRDWSTLGLIIIEE